MISPDHKVIFIHLPGCAGTSIEQCFLGHDWDKIDPPSKHAKWGYYRELHRYEWDHYFRFSIVRNPWDRIKSLSRFQRKPGCLHHMHPPIAEYGMVEFVKSALQNVVSYENFLGEHMHRVYKFEHLEPAWAGIRQVVAQFAPDAPPLDEELHHVNVGDKGFPQRHVTRQEFFAGEQEAIDMIGRHHAVDIDRWGYDF